MTIREGDVLAGKYRVDKVLGQGGMGVVVAATHTTLGQRVAVKSMLATAAGDARARTRFMREARAAATLTSPHVARVYDIGSSDDGVPYIVMELLWGVDLGAMVTNGGPLSSESAAQHVIEACEALAEAHAGGIVHRDLKPSNLFLARQKNGASIIKVLDFGIAKANPFGEEATPLTRTHALVGTPHYMSPEQIRAARDVDGRSDIWSLGITLFELVTGEPPFRGDTVGEIVAAVLQDEPPHLHDVRPSASRDLSDIVGRCLRKDRTQRPRDVAELAAALESVAQRPGAGARVAAILGRKEAPPSLSSERSASPGAVTTHTDFGTTHGGTEGARPWRKRRALAGSIVIALALAGGVWWWRGAPEGRTQTRALALQSDTTTASPSTEEPHTSPSSSALLALPLAVPSVLPANTPVIPTQDQSAQIHPIVVASLAPTALVVGSAKKPSLGGASVPPVAAPTANATLSSSTSSAASAGSSAPSTKSTDSMLGDR